MALPGSGQISLYDIGREWQGYNAPNPLTGNYDPRDYYGGGIADVWNIGSFYKRTDAGASRWAPTSFKRVFSRNDFKSGGINVPVNFGTIPEMSGAISFSNFYGSQIGEA
jgi:hypothetical protein